MGVIDKAEIRIAVVEVLRDGRVGAGFHLGGKGLQIGLWRFGLRVNFRVGRLSDLLFVLARVLNRMNGGDDVYWKSERMRQGA